MGLDMYLVGNKFYWTDWEKPENNKTEDGFKLTDVNLQLAYWRKHPNLHGYIVETFAEGKDECQQIDLGEADIKKIIEAVKEGALPETTGFFFGKSEMTDQERAEDIAFFEKALEWVNTKEKGVSRSVHYRASW